jgi:hypothetical protein
MVNLGGLEISVKSSDEFKKRVRRLTALGLTIYLSTSTLTGVVGVVEYRRQGLAKTEIEEAFSDPRNHFHLEEHQSHNIIKFVGSYSRIGREVGYLLLGDGEQIEEQ